MANVVNTPPRIEITATAAQTEFTWNFLILEAQDLVITYIPIATGVPQTLVLTTDYTINGGSLENEAGGTITVTLGTFPTGAFDGDKFILVRDTVITRIATYTTGGFFPASTVEFEYTDIYLIMQENAREIARALILPDSLTGAVSPWTAPTPVDGQLLAWSGVDGTLVNASPVGVLDTSLYNQILTLTFADSPFVPSLAQEGALFRIDTSGGNVVVNLNALTVDAQDNKYAFVKITGDGNTVTINRGGTDTFDDALTLLTLSSQQFVTDIMGQFSSGVWQTKQHATGGGGAVASVFGRSGAVVAVAGDYTASEVTNVPAGDIAATNVQAAIDELDTEKQPADAQLDDIAAITPVHGDVLFVDSGPNIIKLSPGVAGQFLQSGGPAANVSWASGAGSKVFLGEAVASNSSELTFVDGVSGIVFDSTYDAYEVELLNWLPITDNTGLRLQTGNGSIDSGAGNYAWTVGNAASNITTFFGNSSTSDTHIECNYELGSNMIGNASGESLNGVIRINTPAGTRFHHFSSDLAYTSSAGVQIRTFGNGVRLAASAIDRVRLFQSSDNISGGTARLYGINNA